MSGAQWTGPRAAKFIEEEFQRDMRESLGKRRDAVFRDPKRQDLFLLGLAECFADIERNRLEAPRANDQRQIMLDRAENVREAAEALLAAVKRFSGPDSAEAIDAFEGKIGASEIGAITAARDVARRLVARSNRTVEAFSQSAGGQVRNTDIMPIKRLARYWQDAFDRPASAAPGSAFYEVLCDAFTAAEFQAPSPTTVRGYLTLP